MEIISKERFAKFTPDKVRVLVSMIKGKSPETALPILEFSGKDAATPIISAIRQAMDQVKSKDLNIEDFKIKTIMSDEGPKLKRRRIRHQGRSTAILKRMAHVTVVLSSDDLKDPKKDVIKDIPKTEAKIINKVEKKA